MTFTLNNFVGFETDGFEEASNIDGTPSLTTSSRTGGHALSISSALDKFHIPFTIAGGPSDAGNSRGFGVAINPTIGASGTLALIVSFIDNADQTASLILVRESDTTYKVRVGGPSNETLITSSSTFTEGEWHYIELFWAWSDTAAVELFIDGVSEGSDTGADMKAGSGGLETVSLRDGNATTITNVLFDDIYIASGLTSASDLLGDLEVFGFQTTTTGATADGGVLGNSPTTPAPGDVWENTADTPLNPATDIEFTSNPGGGSVDSAALDAGGDFDGDSNIVGIKGIWHLDRDGGGGSTHSVALGDSNDGDSPAATTVALTTTPTNFMVLRTTDLPQVSESGEAIRQGAWTGGAQDIHIFEMWAMIAHVPTIDTPPEEGISRYSGFILVGAF